MSKQFWRKKDSNNQQSRQVGQAVNKRYGMEEWSSSASDLLIGIGSVCYDDISNSAVPRKNIVMKQYCTSIIRKGGVSKGKYDNSL